MSTEESVVPKKSKGQLFKEKHGISRTMARNMKRANVLTIEEYRQIRKARKKKQSLIKKGKHTTAKAQRAGKAVKKK